MTVIGLVFRGVTQPVWRAKPRSINMFPALRLPANRPDRKFRLDLTPLARYAELWQPFTLWSP